MLPHLRSFENSWSSSLHWLLCPLVWASIRICCTFPTRLWVLGACSVSYIKRVSSHMYLLLQTSPREEMSEICSCVPFAACYVKLYVPCNIADFKWQMSDSAWHHPSEDWKHSVIPDVRCHVDKSPDDWLNFSVFIGMIGIVCTWPCVINPRTPHHHGFKKWLSWTQVFRELLMGHSILLHVLLTGKLTTSGPKAISVISPPWRYQLALIRHSHVWSTFSNERHWDKH